MWTGRLSAEPGDLVGLVVGEVALIPEPLGLVFAIALPSQDMGRDPIQEPAVVRDHHGTSGKVEKSILQRLESFHVKIIGRFVEQQQVAAHFQRQRQIEAVAFTAGQDTGRLLLIRALEPERGDVGPGGHFFFFNDTATTEIYTLSLHDALPILLEYSRRLPPLPEGLAGHREAMEQDRKSTRLNSSHTVISYAVFCLKKKKT